MDPCKRRPIFKKLSCRDLISHITALYDQNFFCAVCIVNLSSASIPRDALVHEKLLFHSPLHYYQTHWFLWLLTLLSHLSFWDPLLSAGCAAIEPPHLLFMRTQHNLDQIVLIAGTELQFKSGQGFFTLCLNFAQNFALLSQDSASQHHQCFLSELKHN